MSRIQFPGRSGYYLDKLLRYGITLFLILTINFFIPRMMPGDPMVNLIGQDVGHVDRATLEEMRHQYGLDRPLVVQYLDYLTGLATINLGYSIHNSLDVTVLLKDRLYRTALLVLPSVVLGAVLALVAGSIAGFRAGSLADSVLTSAVMILYTCPGFLVAMLAVSLFSFHLNLFPLGNMSSGYLTGLSYWADVGWHLFLPIAVLSILGAVYDFIVVRSSIKQVLGEYFIFVARAKGLPDRAIKYRHVLRNALPQIITIVALNFGFVVSGALVVEIVFSLDGMGSLVYGAVMARDYPVLQGAFLAITLCVLLANFAADLLYGIADPRIGDSMGRRQVT